MSRPVTDAQRKALKKYKAATMRAVRIDLNKNTEADLIVHLESLTESRAGYIKRLIREDMERGTDA